MTLLDHEPVVQPTAQVSAKTHRRRHSAPNMDTVPESQDPIRPSQSSPSKSIGTKATAGLDRDNAPSDVEEDDEPQSEEDNDTKDRQERGKDAKAAVQNLAAEVSQTFTVKNY
ncbi:hypothetical protein BDZ89DRAFT_1076424 [Hymenopellis radicata]|nr:hypothetical protein BDZ89DRAFT_1076424 [Hymenopellis radicata]